AGSPRLPSARSRSSERRPLKRWKWYLRKASTTRRISPARRTSKYSPASARGRVSSRESPASASAESATVPASSPAQRSHRSPPRAGENSRRGESPAAPGGEAPPGGGGAAALGARAEPRAIAEQARDLELERDRERRQRPRGRNRHRLERCGQEVEELGVRLLAPHQAIDQLERRLGVRQPLEVLDPAAGGGEGVGLGQQGEVGVGLQVVDVAPARERLEREAETARGLARTLRHQLHEAVLARVDHRDAAGLAERVGLEHDAFAGDERHGYPCAGRAPAAVTARCARAAFTRAMSGWTTPPETITLSPSSIGQSR